MYMKKNVVAVFVSGAARSRTSTCFCDPPIQRTLPAHASPVKRIVVIVFVKTGDFPNGRGCHEKLILFFRHEKVSRKEKMALRGTDSESNIN